MSNCEGGISFAVQTANIKKLRIFFPPTHTLSLRLCRPPSPCPGIPSGSGPARERDKRRRSTAWKKINFESIFLCCLGEISPSDVDDPDFAARDHPVRQGGGELGAEEAAKVRRGTQQADLLKHSISHKSIMLFKYKFKKSHRGDVLP